MGILEETESINGPNAVYLQSVRKVIKNIKGQLLKVFIKLERYNLAS
jgi:hypothetical protein